MLIVHQFWTTPIFVPATKCKIYGPNCNVHHVSSNILLIFVIKTNSVSKLSKVDDSLANTAI